jgi:replicative DNA helicase
MVNLPDNFLSPENLAWDTSLDELRYLGICLEYFGPIGRKEDKLMELLSSGVDETWFSDERNSSLFVGVFKAAMLIGQKDITANVSGIIQAAEENCGEVGWAATAIRDAMASVGILNHQEYVDNDIPVWWSKLRKPKIQKVIGEVYRLLEASPTVGKVQQVERLLEVAQEEWIAIPEISRKQEGLISSVRDLVLQPRKESSCISTGLKALDFILGGGFAGTDSLEEGKLIVVMGRPGSGKALRNSEPVLMADGTWKKISDLEINDAVASIDGKPSMVLGVYPQGVKRLFRVTFSDGKFVDCCGEHLWKVSSTRWRGKFNETRIINTIELLEYLMAKRYKNRITVETVSGDFGTPLKSGIHPWLLGALLGDGSMTGSSIGFSSEDKELVLRCAILCPESVKLTNRNRYDWYLTTERGQPNPLLSWLQHYGLHGKKSEDKFIPEEYMRATRAERLDLLRGLMDTDGWVEGDGGTAVYSSSSKQLALDVQKLVRSLGGWSSIKEKFPTYTYKGEKKQGKVNYLVNVRIEDNPFSLSRKKDAMKNRKNIRTASILSVKMIDADEATCITVSHDSSLFITRDYIVTHNTLFATTLAMRTILGKEPTKVAFWSLEMNAKQLAMRIIAGHDHDVLMETKADYEPIAYDRLRTGYFEDEMVERLKKRNYDRLDQNLSVYGPAPDITVHSVIKKMKLIIKKHPETRLFVIDHLGLFSLTNNNEVAGIGEITRSLKLTAVSLGVDIILLSQLNRGVEGRADKKPAMSDARGSGRIEEDADVILGLYREHYYDKSADPHRLEICCLKNRQGASGDFPVRVKLDCCVVYD